MITKVNAYQSSDGTAHSSLEEAQKAEIKALFKREERANTSEWLEPSLEYIADLLVENAGQVVDILTTTPTSKPKARKVNGGTKRRKKGEQLQTEPLPLVAAEEVKK